MTIIPGPLTSRLLTTPLPVPARVRATNALTVGEGPGFVLDLEPRHLVGHLLDNIDLRTWTRPGTTPEAAPDDANQARISLVRPTLTFDPATRRLHGWATLSVGTDYPPAFKGPTELSVEVTSDELGPAKVQLGYGPLTINSVVRLHYDPSRLESAAAPVFAPAGGAAGFWGRFQAILSETVPGIDLTSASGALQGLLDSVASGEIQAGDLAARAVQLLGDSVPAGADLNSLRTALTQLATEITHPGFSVRGTARLFGAPIAAFGASAPTTVPLARPLLNAPTAFPLEYWAAGIVIAPAGSVSSVAVPVLGGTFSNFGAKQGGSVAGGLLPSISTDAISAHEPLVSQLPVYAYVEANYVRRVTEGFDIGIRVTLQTNTPELFGPKASQTADPLSRFQQTQADFLKATQPGGPPPVTPTAGVSVFGRF